MAGIYWFTGLSGSGKTTLSTAVAERIRALGKPCLMLDGDQLRKGLCSDLVYSPKDRFENIRRAGEMALIMAQQGHVCLCAFITPYRAMREDLRARLSPFFHEIFVDCPLDECIRRDPKSFYKQAKNGQIAEYTGVSAPYEPPTCPDLHVKTAENDVESLVEEIVRYINKSRGL